MSNRIQGYLVNADPLTPSILLDHPPKPGDHHRRQEMLQEPPQPNHWVPLQFASESHCATFG